MPAANMAENGLHAMALLRTLFTVVSSIQEMAHCDLNLGFVTARNLVPENWALQARLIGSSALGFAKFS